MESNVLFLFLGLGVLALVQLASIARSLRNTEAMLERFLFREGVEPRGPIEPSERVRELASNSRTYVAAIKAYREQTGLGLREARAVVDELARPRHGAA